MRTVTLLVALLVLVLQAAQAQTTTQFTTYFTGGLPFCTQCGTVGQYACSPDANGVTLGQWNNGVISFTDPVPSGNYATNVAVSVFGAFSCNAVGARAMFGMSLNSLVFGVRDTSKGINQCKCDTCDGSENFSFVFRNGVPGYRYRTTNSLKFELYKDSICVNRVEVTITYAPTLTSPPTPLPELYVPFTIPTGYDRVGCPVCNGNLNQWCSAANNNTLTLSFKDTLPANTYLIAVDAYLSLNLIERASSYASTITVAVQNTNVNTFTLSETGFKEKCGCLSDHTLTSATYQRGWPNYAANGGINKVSVSIAKYSQSYGNICVGRLALKLMYYTYTKDGEMGELEAMYLDNVDYKVDQVDVE